MINDVSGAWGGPGKSLAESGLILGPTAASARRGIGRFASAKVFPRRQREKVLRILFANSQIARAVSTGGNRTAKFIREQLPLLPGLPGVAQLLVEAAARARHAGVDGRAHDDMTRIFQNDFFGGELCLAINMDRVHRVGLSIISLAPVKNQIRGKENERNFRREFASSPVTSTFTRRASSGFACAPARVLTAAQ